MEKKCSSVILFGSDEYLVGLAEHLNDHISAILMTVCTHPSVHNELQFVIHVPIHI